MAEISTKPYMIRAIHAWCTDNGYTPYLLVKVGGKARVPMQHVQNDEIVLNVSSMATNALQIGNDVIRFEARFNGVPEHIIVPVGNVAAIYARETGSGMAFSPEIDEGDDLADQAGQQGRTPALAAVPPADGADGAGNSGNGAVLAFGRKGRDRSKGGRGDGMDGNAARATDADAGSRADGQGGAGGERQRPPSGLRPAGAADSSGSTPPDDEPPPAGGGKPRLVRVK